LLCAIVFCGLVGLHGHAGTVASSGINWVRTVDGWQPRRVVDARRPAAPPTLHPTTVAAFQLMASLLALTAFPTRVQRMKGACLQRATHLPWRLAARAAVHPE
jgi:hypothetical protein